MKKVPYEIVEVAVCAVCNTQEISEEGAIICPKCHTQDPKIRYEHFILTLKPSKPKWKEYIKK